MAKKADREATIEADSPVNIYTHEGLKEILLQGVDMEVPHPVVELILNLQHMCFRLGPVDVWEENIVPADLQRSEKERRQIKEAFRVFCIPITHVPAKNAKGEIVFAQPEKPTHLLLTVARRTGDSLMAQGCTSAVQMAMVKRKLGLGVEDELTDKLREKITVIDVVDSTMWNVQEVKLSDEFEKAASSHDFTLIISYNLYAGEPAENQKEFVRGLVHEDLRIRINGTRSPQHGAQMIQDFFLTGKYPDELNALEA